MGSGYYSLWNKYRPAILHQMIESACGPQDYKLFAHEFRSLNPKEKEYSFTLTLLPGEKGDHLRTPLIARDLMQVLASSRKATELLALDSYEFFLDKKFVLHIRRVAEGS
jgi:hypothetical protein